MRSFLTETEMSTGVGCGKASVLVVDDDRRMVKTICDILRIKGFDAIPAYDGPAAMEEIRSGSVDCVLMDLKMPGINGVEALKMIKGIDPEIPVLLMSAYASEEHISEAKANGALAVLNKPFGIRSLLCFLDLLKRRESILLVDDASDRSEDIAEILKTRGYNVETEADPKKVMDHMEQEYKLAVVIDLEMRGAGALDVLKSVRRKYSTKPVILVAGRRDIMATSIEKAFRVDAFLYKPLEPEALMVRLGEIRRQKLQRIFADAS